MFYESRPEPYLRFGDVITGIPHCICRTSIKKRDKSELSLTHDAAVVLTPCCSIGRDGVLTLAPLEHINPSWMKNDHFQEDLCKINSPMLPVHTISTEYYQHLDLDEKAKYSGKEYKYTLVDFFVYAPDALLTHYSFGKNHDTGYYCIQFPKICSIQFDDFKYNKGNTPPIESGIKLLELSDGTRECLRKKLIHFFSRTAE